MSTASRTNAVSTHRERHARHLPTWNPGDKDVQHGISGGSAQRPGQTRSATASEKQQQSLTDQTMREGHLGRHAHHRHLPNTPGLTGQYPSNIDPQRSDCSNQSQIASSTYKPNSVKLTIEQEISLTSAVRKELSKHLGFDCGESTAKYVVVMVKHGKSTTACRADLSGLMDASAVDALLAWLSTNLSHFTSSPSDLINSRLTMPSKSIHSDHRTEGFKHTSSRHSEPHTIVLEHLSQLPQEGGFQSLVAKLLTQLIRKSHELHATVSKGGENHLKACMAAAEHTTSEVLERCLRGESETIVSNALDQHHNTANLTPADSPAEASNNPQSNVPSAPPPPPAPTTGVPPPPAPPCALTKSHDQSFSPKPTKRMKKFDWKKLTLMSPKGRNSLWKELGGQRRRVYREQKKLVTPSFSALESNFCIKTPIHDPLNEKKKPNELEFLDEKRARTLNIFLGSLHSDWHDLLRALREFDFKVVTEGRALLLQDALPAPDEEEMLRERSAALGSEERRHLAKGDQFLLALMDISSFRELVHGICIEDSFAEEFHGIHAPVDATLAAVRAISHSEEIDLLLLYILDAGNFINGSTFNGNAQGFTLDALTRLRDIRNGDYTLLHQVLRLCP